jgi:hypothetical protein
MTQETAAPMSIITAAAVNTTTNPLWNGPEIKSGKNCFPVSTAALTGGVEYEGAETNSTTGPSYRPTTTSTMARGPAGRGLGKEVRDPQWECLRRTRISIPPPRPSAPAGSAARFDYFESASSSSTGRLYRVAIVEQQQRIQRHQQQRQRIRRAGGGGGSR